MMRGRVKVRCAATIGVVLGTLAVPARALPMYSVQSIGVPAGAEDVRGYGINSGGQIAVSSPGGPNGYRWSGGVFERLTGGVGQIPLAINDAGTLAGISHVIAPLGVQQLATLWAGGVPFALGAGSAYHGIAYAINESSVVAGTRAFGHPWFPMDHRATVWVGGLPVDLGTLGGTYSEARDINEHNQVVGSSTVTPGSNAGFAFLWQAGVMINLGGLTGGSAAYAINDHGVVAAGLDVCPVVGRPCVRQAALWEADVWTPLGALEAAANSSAYDINNSGLAVGYSDTARGGSRATLWSEEGSIVDLNDFLSPEQRAAGWELRVAWGVNDAGQIVATGSESQSGSTRTFLLTPAAAQPPNGVPEPGTAALVGLAAVLGGLARRAMSRLLHGGARGGGFHFAR